jgi:predicted O-methyltransferase YrrM
MNHFGVWDFVRQNSQSKTPFLLELEALARKQGVPIIKPEVARFLEMICLLKKPIRILEIGTAIGYSAMVMAHILEKKVCIDTVEVSPERVLCARENILKYGFSENIRVIYGDGLDVLNHLTKSYDLLFFDGAKGQYKSILMLGLKRLTQGGVLITDNVFCGGRIFEEADIPRRKKTMVRNVKDYIQEAMGADCASSLVPIGDGVLISMKKHS